MNLHLFELIDPLEAGRTAEARLLKWDGEKYVPSAEMITVRDFVGSHGKAGDRGSTFLSDQSKCWEVLSGLRTQDDESIV
jgi:hypothetical protein